MEMESSACETRIMTPHVHVADGVRFAPQAFVTDALAEQGFLVAGGLALDDSDLPHRLARDFAALNQWLDSSFHASMHFMRENLDARRDVAKILPSARSALIIIAPYATGKRVRGRVKGEASELVNSDANSLMARGLVARYARGRDYHKQIRRSLAPALRAAFDGHGLPEHERRIIVDSAPFLERAHSRLAGLGFIGKNTMLIRPGAGSYFFLASVLLSLPIDVWCTVTRASSSMRDLSCGTCRRCLDACPTGAIVEPYQLDANRCLSYLTIEHRDIIPPTYLPGLSHTLFGCDICQEVCPYNISTLDLVRLKELGPSNPALMTISAWDVAFMTHEQYEKWFGGTAMTRAKYGGLVRNALCHLFATGDPRLHDVLERRAGDDDPLVSRTVVQLRNILAAIPGRHHQ